MQTTQIFPLKLPAHQQAKLPYIIIVVNLIPYWSLFEIFLPTCRSESSVSYKTASGAGKLLSILLQTCKSLLKKGSKWGAISFNIVCSISRTTLEPLYAYVKWSKAERIATGGYTRSGLIEEMLHSSFPTLFFFFYFQSACAPTNKNFTCFTKIVTI